MENDQLLTDESILTDELGFASKEIEDCGGYDRIAGRMGEAEEGSASGRTHMCFSTL
jgi:hypothetical protein